jgi:hypothetical protein
VGLEDETVTSLTGLAGTDLVVIRKLELEERGVNKVLCSLSLLPLSVLSFRSTGPVC